jgi:hypothetical protein
MSIKLGLQTVNHYDMPYIAPAFNSNVHLVVHNYNAKYLDPSSRGMHL